MLKKVFTFEDFNGNVRTEVCYFHLSEAEVTEMEIESEVGFIQEIEDYINRNQGSEIMAKFKDLILKSYGIKSPDGLYFEKSPEISQKFLATPMYTELYMTLLTDPKAAAEFVAGVLPKEKTDEQKAKLSKTNYERLSEELDAGKIIPMAAPAAPVE